MRHRFKDSAPQNEFDAESIQVTTGVPG
jgi:hypothetical protein